MITSTGNARIKAVSALAKKAKLRREQKLFLVEGPKMFAELPKERLMEAYVSESFLSQQGERAEQLLSGSKTAAEQLTVLGLSRVVEKAAEYAGWNVLLLDLIQEGSVGLWEAIGSYRGGDYFAHRDRMIHNAICKAIILQARNNGLGQKMRQSLQDFRRMDEKLLAELGRNPSLEEIAAGMKITPEEAECLKKMMDDAVLLEQAEKLVQPKEETPEDDQAVEDTAYFQMRQRILELMSVLDETDAKLISLRFGLEGGMPLSPEETGKRLNLTPDEVVAREANALSKLRSER